MFLLYSTVKGLWERAPQGWPADVPYCDPNNAPLRSRTGEPVGTKPKKETLNQMFDFLIREYLVRHAIDPLSVYNCVHVDLCACV